MGQEEFSQKESGARERRSTLTQNRLSESRVLTFGTGEKEGPGYAISQKKRKLVEELFGWAKTSAGSPVPMLRGAKRLGFKFRLTMAAYDLICLPKLIGAVA